MLNLVVLAAMALHGGAASAAAAAWASGSACAGQVDHDDVASTARCCGGDRVNKFGRCCPMPVCTVLGARRYR